MARWIVMADMPVPPGVKDSLDGPYLLFTSNFDGDLATYMDELVERASPQLGEIYAHCIGCPQPAEGAALKAYIGRNQIDAGVVFAAYGAASVQDVLRAIDKRARLIDFVVRAQDMEPAQRRSAFLEEFGSVIDLADVQGDILRAYGNAYDCTSYAFVKIDCEPERARAWFAGLLRPRHDRRAVARRQAADDA